MSNETPRSESVAQNLLQLFLLERTIVGLLNWVRDAEPPFDPRFRDYLGNAGKKNEAARLYRQQAALASLGVDPFDNGLMLSHLLCFLRSDEPRQEPAEGGSPADSAVAAQTAKPKLLKSPLRDNAQDRGTLYENLEKLTTIRNKCMHGLDYQHSVIGPLAAPDETARLMAILFAVLRRLLTDQLKSLETAGRWLKRDHTRWARLLYLSFDELRWISRGRALPKEDDPLPPSLSFKLPVEPGSANGSPWCTITLRRTDYDADKPFDLQHMPGSTPRWVAEVAVAEAWLKGNLDDVKGQLAAFRHEDLRHARVDVSEWGPVNPDPDWFDIPWWRAADPGKAFLCLSAHR